MNLLTNPDAALLDTLRAALEAAELAELNAPWRMGPQRRAETQRARRAYEAALI